MRTFVRLGALTICAILGACNKQTSAVDSDSCTGMPSAAEIGSALTAQPGVGAGEVIAIEGCDAYFASSSADQRVMKVHMVRALQGGAWLAWVNGQNAGVGVRIAVH